MCGVESTFGVRLPEEVRAASEAGAPPYEGRGPPPKERAAPLYTAREVIGSLPEEAWRTVNWREGTKGTLSKQMVALECTGRREALVTASIMNGCSPHRRAG